MYTNADITLYSCIDGAFKTYTRQVIEKVFWSDSKQGNVKATGLVTADSVKLRIPHSSANGLKFNIAKDFIIKEIITDEIDNTSAKTVSETFKILQEKYDTHTVTSADNKDYGSTSMRHYDLSLK